MNFGNWNGLLKRVPAFALVAAAVWLLARIAISAWELARLEPPAPLAGAPAAEARTAEPQAPGSRLFGQPAVNPPPSGSPVPLDSGDYRLRGVVAATRKGMAHAIIESGGVTRAYFAGQSLTSGLTLHEVRPNEVHLRRGAEILRLPLSDAGPPVAGGGPVRSGLSQFPIAEPPGILKVPPRRSLSQLLRMEPVMDSDGGMQGYRVFPRGQRAVFDALGLVSGDRIVAINGVSIDNENLPESRRRMSAEGDMMLTVDRDGQQLEILVGNRNFDLLAM